MTNSEMDKFCKLTKGDDEIVLKYWPLFSNTLPVSFIP